ncbi:hypothetical protein P4489_19615 [Heyndrickxia sporothermodurans]|uniref:hypothetical protein n=1 Tax=Heyndrickxia sporothermodurans TaxID=46224 RepID=UPI002E1B6596|nr:hypothetical protein [Heyndrickxia sporothermodurans]
MAKEKYEWDFYSSLKTMSVPNYIQLLEMIQENDIDESDPLYTEIMGMVQSEMNYINSLHKGWRHPKKRLPVTREEFVVEMYMIIKEFDKIPDEYYHIVDEFRYWHGADVPSRKRRDTTK